MFIRLRMFTSPQSIHSPSLGQRLTFLESDAETLRFEASIDAGSSTPMHIHECQTETFRVLEGELTVWAAGQRLALGPGETVSAGAGIPHRFRNDSAEAVRVSVEIRPALRTRELFEAIFALDHAGRINHRGSPGLLEGARLM